MIRIAAYLLAPFLFAVAIVFLIGCGVAILAGAVGFALIAGASEVLRLLRRPAGGRREGLHQQ